MNAEKCHRMQQTAYHACNGRKKKGGASYPPYMADAKEETPNEGNGMTKEEHAALKYRERNEEK